MQLQAVLDWHSALATNSHLDQIGDHKEIQTTINAILEQGQLCHASLVELQKTLEVCTKILYENSAVNISDRANVAEAIIPLNQGVICVRILEVVQALHSISVADNKEKS